MNFFCVSILLLFTYCHVLTISAETYFEKLPRQKYSIVNLIQETASRIHGEKDLNFVLQASTTYEENELKQMSNRVFDPLLTDFLRNKTNVKCMEDLLYFFKNLGSPGGWASKMVDSWGKPESGIFQGNIKWLGDFDECIDVYVPAKANSSLGNFHGQYCSLTVAMHLGNVSIPLSIGTCLPDSCHSSDTRSNDSSQINWQDPFHPQEEMKDKFGDIKLACTPTSRKLTTEAIAVICLISVFVLLAILGSSITLYEHFFTSTEGNFGKIFAVNANCEREALEDDDVLLIGSEIEILPSWIEKFKPFFNCFCIFTNGSKLLDTSSSEGQLPCLHGIRFLSLSWVIVCHTYGFSFTAIRNIAEVITLIDNWPFQVILNGFFSVDSFFLLSGFLVAYIFFDQSSKNNGKIPWIYFYVHRYIRLTPVYMILLAIDTTLYSYLGSGPSWVNYDTDPLCSKSWWRNLFYINNFQHAVDMCFAWSWYLANDMQFFIVSPVILVTLWRWPRIGWSVLAAFLTATFVSNFALTYHYDLITGLGNILSITDMQDFMTKWLDFFDYVYIRPYTRMSPYLVGIALAYHLFRRKQNNTGKDSLLVLCSGWIISATITLLCLFGIYHKNLSLIESCFYNALSRTGFSLGLAWVIYVCLTGQGGFINSFLSYKLFIPLSRLTYCAYLVHPIIVIGYFASLKTLISFSHITLVILFLGMLLISYFAALVASLLFESPVIRLDKYFCSKFSKS